MKPPIHRPNFTMQMGTLSNVGLGTPESVVGILTRFDYAVINVLNWADTDEVSLLTEVAGGYRLARPKGLLAGATEWTGNMATWQAVVDNWVAISGIDAIFVKNFGSAVDRDTANQIVDYIHTAGLAAFVTPDPGSLPLALIRRGSEAEPSLGRHATIKDYVLLTNFYGSDGTVDTTTETDNTVWPPVVTTTTTYTLDKEDISRLYGRLAIVKAAPVKLGTPPAMHSLYKFGFIGQVGAGPLPEIPEADYKAILELVNKYEMDGIGITDADDGVTAKCVWTSRKKNDLTPDLL